MPLDAAIDASYSFNPLRADRDEIRFLVGDTDPAEFLLADAEIDAAMALARAAGNPAGTLSASTLAVNGTTAAGATTINLDATSVSGTVAAGASFTIAGNTQRYFVSGELTAASNALTGLEFWPGLAASAADDAVVTFRLYDVHEAAALCCDNLARRFARKADVSIDGRSESFSQISTQYAELARTLRRQSSGAGGSFGRKLVRV